MSIIDTSHKRKSIILTSIIMCFLFVIIFFFGLKYLDPPTEYGIAVNFGTSDVGMGNIQPKAPLKATNPKVAEPQEKVTPQEETTIEETVTKTVEKIIENTEDVATQNNEESIAIKKQEKAKIAEQKAIAEQKRLAKVKADAIKKKQEEEAKKRSDLDALMGGFNTGSGEATGGEGDDNSPGDKGKITGDINAKGYTGNGGGNGTGNYNLGNRQPLNRPKPDYLCEEEGLVIVRIEVNNTGEVIRAIAGVKGSTNTADCLLSQAKKAALQTKWQADSNAPQKQIGTIKYRFSLSQ
ncbi:MAG: energy transducer TonB [Flavobacteriaceae bacterium]|nr:MAG: energy transducer TonB [Flavobacteriaceae bacterium]